MSSPDYEVDEMWCGHCDNDTIHICRYDTHERDSTQNFFVCTECRWAYHGLSGKYDKPDDYSEFLIEEYRNGKIR